MTTACVDVPGVSAAAVEAMATERLEAEICTLAGHMTAAMCRWLLMVAEFDERDGWSAWGIVSCAHWLSWRCGTALSTARDHVRVARRLKPMPLITASFAAGEISYAKVRAILRVATPETEAQLLELARELTASQLEQTVAAYLDSDDDHNDDTEPEDDTWVRTRRQGRYLIITHKVLAEDGAAYLDALEVAARYNRDGDAPAGGEGDSAESLSEPDTVIRTSWAGERARAEAALTLARAGAAALRTPVDDDIEAERAHLVLHVLTDERDEDGHPHVHLDGGPPLKWKTACRLACAAKVTAMVKDLDGNPLHLGRTTRDVSPRLRRALWFRDRGCRFPGCTHRRFLHAHHINWWSKGGFTCITNLVLVCSRHHHLLHEGGFTVSVKGNMLSFFRPDGTLIEPAGGRPVALDPNESITAVNEQLGLDITPDTPGSLSNGARMRLADTVDALWWILQPERMLN